MSESHTGEHGAGALVLELRLQPEPTAASQARAAIRSALAKRLDPTVIENLLMVASELVSNSVMHAALPPDEHISLRLWSNSRLRLEVEDRGRGFARSAADPLVRAGDPGGRGLAIVAALSDRWAREEDQTVWVWAELPARSPTGPVAH